MNTLAGGMDSRDAALVGRLEERFRHITELLYDTSIPSHRLDEEVLPFVDQDICFTDPWQQACGREAYRRGAAGFHCMFHFDFVIRQLHVRLEDPLLDETARKGRALVDGVMRLRQLGWLYTFPLRTFLVYEFVLTAPGSDAPEPPFVIHSHEELWSFGDMLAAVPLLGWGYRRLFRPGFSRAFLAASAACQVARGARGVS